MHLDHILAAGASVQRVDVLGDDRPDEPAPLELGERQVRGVRLGGAEQIDPLAVEAPDTGRIASERVDGGDLEGIDVGPDSRGGAKVRDPGLVLTPAPVSTTHGWRSRMSAASAAADTAGS